MPPEASATLPSISLRGFSTHMETLALILGFPFFLRMTCLHCRPRHSNSGSPSIEMAFHRPIDDAFILLSMSHDLGLSATEMQLALLQPTNLYRLPRPSNLVCLPVRCTRSPYQSHNSFPGVNLAVTIAVAKRVCIDLPGSTISFHMT